MRRSLALHEAGHAAILATRPYIRSTAVRHDHDGSIVLLPQPPIDRWPLRDAIAALLGGAVGELIGNGWIAEHLTINDCRRCAVHAAADFVILDSLRGIGVEDEIFDAALVQAVAAVDAIDLLTAADEFAAVMRRIPRGKTGMLNRPASAALVQ